MKVSYVPPLRVLNDADQALIVRANIGCSIFIPNPVVGNRMPAQPTMAGILEGVARRYGLSVKQLRGRSQSHQVAHPRQEAMWLMRQVMRDGEHRYSLPQIGYFLDYRDHTTVLHGVRAHQKRLDRAEAAMQIAAE